MTVKKLPKEMNYMDCLLVAGIFFLQSTCSGRVTSKKMTFEGLEQEILQLKQVVAKQGETIRTQGDVIEQHETFMESIAERMNNETTSYTLTYSTYGCVGEIMTLSCPSGQTINATGGEYRQRSFACDQPNVTCCPVQMAQSCSERLEDSAPQDLIAIKVLCDGQNSCSFTNQGGYLGSCSDSDRVDTMTVWYDCLPGEAILGQIGFTAIPLVSRTFDNYKENIIFDNIQDHFGNHYSGKSSAFTCPVSGMYLAYVAIHSANELKAAARIIVEETYQPGVRTDASYGHASSSTLVVLRCLAGERITVRTVNDISNNYVFGQDSKKGYSIFTVVLLQADKH